MTTSRSVNSSLHSAPAVRQPRSSEAAVVDLVGALRAPEGARLRSEVQFLLRRGERRIVVSLGGVSYVDAAGIGELVRAYNLTAAAGGNLRVSDATGRVREVLARVGLLKILTAA